VTVFARFVDVLALHTRSLCRRRFNVSPIGSIKATADEDTKCGSDQPALRQRRRKCENFSVLQPNAKCTKSHQQQGA
jgi:hypothetical protein